jgi:hypothetical protein
VQLPSSATDRDCTLGANPRATPPNSRSLPISCAFNQLVEHLDANDVFENFRFIDTSSNVSTSV